MVQTTEDVNIIAKFIDQASPGIQRMAERTRNSMLATSVASRKFSEDLAKNEGRFQGWALSVMFLGMAIQRTMSTIWKSSTKAFNDVMHSVEGTVTNMDLLNSSMMYLKFVVGQALEPVLEHLIPIIEAIANWVHENQGLTRAIVVVGTVIGALLFAIGFLTLGISGIVTGVNNAVAAFTFLKTAVSAVSGTLLAATAIVAGLVAVLVIIFKMKEEMGGWIPFFANVVKGILRVLALLVSGVAGVVSEIVNAFQWMWNMVVEAAEGVVNTFITMLNGILKAYNAIPFLGDVNLIAKVNFDAAKADVEDFGVSFINTYGNMMSKYLDWESSVFGQGATETPAPTTTNSSVVNNYNDITINGTNMSTDEIIAEYNRRSGIGG